MRKLRKETDGQDREDSSEGTSLRSTQGFPGPGSPGQMPEVLESYGMLCDGCVRNGELGGGQETRQIVLGPVSHAVDLGHFPLEAVRSQLRG